MSRFILGIHGGHNASAAIGTPTRLEFAIQEERLTGEKNYWGFPFRSVQACLEAVGAEPSDIEVIAYGGKAVMADYHGRDDVLRSYERQSSLSGKIRQQVLMPARLLLQRDYGTNTLPGYLEAAGLSGVPVSFTEHHRNHASTAYFGLRSDPDREYLVLTCDGAGDGICASVTVMGGGRPPRELARTTWANSLGALYSWVTYGYGFVPLEHEYKLMGMAPYAPSSGAEQVAEVFRSYLGLDAKGLGFQRRHMGRINDAWGSISKALRGIRFDYVFAGLQLFTEELLTSWARNAVRASGCSHILAGGGVFMNVKANQCIAALPEVDTFQAFPSCGDETLSLGAVWMEAARKHEPSAIEPLHGFYLGDDIDDSDAEKAIRDCGLQYERPGSMAHAVAALLVTGVPVARCAGRMEFGARALGNRSILADPSNSDVVRTINQMVKKRDFWMPFAPMIRDGRTADYIKNPKSLDSPYMMMTFDTTEQFREMIAAVHNADLTCRAQILDRDRNPEMYEIIEAFEETTGRGVVLNTSFNLHGFPIVRTPAEALDVLMNSGLEHLQVGPYLVHKT